MQSSDLDKAKARELFEEGNADDNETTISTFIECTGPGTGMGTYIHSFTFNLTITF